MSQVWQHQGSDGARPMLAAGAVSIEPACSGGTKHHGYQACSGVRVTPHSGDSWGGPAAAAGVRLDIPMAGLPPPSPSTPNNADVNAGVSWVDRSGGASQGHWGCWGRHGLGQYRCTWASPHPPPPPPPKLKGDSATVWRPGPTAGYSSHCRREPGNRKS